MTSLANDALAGPGAVVTLTGSGAGPAREASIELLRGLGVPTLVERNAPSQAALEMAAQIRSVVLTGAPATDEDVARVRDRGARCVCVWVEAGERPNEVARKVLGSVDHGLEVATRPIFVVGAGRSGTTWVFDLLTSHPQVAGAFETTLFAPENLAYLHNPDSFHERRRSDDGRYPKGMWQLASRKEVRDAIRGTAANWLARTVSPQHNWLVEKTPSQAQSVAAIMEVLPDSRFVHVVRDPRDIVVSRLHRRLGDYVPDNLADLQPAPPIKRWAREWERTMRLMSEAAGFAPVYEIRYETLISSPTEACRGLFAFCEIPCESTELAAIIDRNRIDTHTRRGTGEFRRAGRVGDWRTDLSRGQVALIRSIAGREMAERGYIGHPGLPYVARGVARSAKRTLSGSLAGAGHRARWRPRSIADLSKSKSAS